MYHIYEYIGMWLMNKGLIIYSGTRASTVEWVIKKEPRRVQRVDNQIERWKVKVNPNEH